MHAVDDPTSAWVRETWAPRETDSPLYKLIGEKGRTETRARGAG